MSPAVPAGTRSAPTRVAVLGGGIAGLTAAFELTRPVHEGAYDVTVYTQGWRLGGKGASGRWGPHARIHEHGLHVWFGFYHNALGLMDECLVEQALHRPSAPAHRLRDAFAPVDELALVDGGRAYRLPLPDADVGDSFFARLPRLIVTWLRRVAATLEIPGTVRGPWGPAALARAELQARLGHPHVVHYGHIADHLGTAATPAASALGDLEAKVAFLGRIAQLWSAVLRGLAVDVLVHAPDTWGAHLDALNGVELRTWLARHGADADVVQAPFVRALYDLVFAYRGGDPAAPEIAAGVGIENLVSIFGRNRGSCMLKLRGGMGDVVFVPLHEVLERRGVSFAFFHTVTALGTGVGADGPVVDRVDLVRQVELAGPPPAPAPGAAYEPPAYAPLIDLGDVQPGLRCWPAEPRADQLAPASRDALAALGRPVDLEREPDPLGGPAVRLQRGVDFDAVVLAIPVGALTACCPQLVAQEPRFAAMLRAAEPVATQAAQLWISRDRTATGWPCDADRDTILGNARQPFATLSDMTHVLPVERWSGPEAPLQVAYLCGVLADADAAGRDWRAVDDGVHDRALAWLREHVAAADSPFWEDLDPRDLVDPRGGVAWARFDAQYWRGNAAPWERYSPPFIDAVRHRMAPGEAPWGNLALAGDWTRTQVNAGCVEAAVMSGILAAAAVIGAGGDAPHPILPGWRNGDAA